MFCRYIAKKAEKNRKKEIFCFLLSWTTFERVFSPDFKSFFLLNQNSFRENRIWCSNFCFFFYALYCSPIRKYHRKFWSWNSIRCRVFVFVFLFDLFISIQSIQKKKFQLIVVNKSLIYLFTTSQISSIWHLLLL